MHKNIKAEETKVRLKNKAIAFHFLHAVAP